MARMMRRFARVESSQSRLRVFIDARLAVRGLGISSATSRLLAAIEDNDNLELRVNASPHGWNRRGQAHTAVLSGALDVWPSADPRTWRHDVVHYYGNTAPQFDGSATVITVHDLMCLRGASLKSRVYRALLLPGLRRAQRAQIVAISKQTADDLLDLLPSLSDRLTVISHGHTPGRFSAAERRHIFMFGGQGDPRKRIDLGLAAYVRYRERTGSAALPLVIAGRAGVDRSSVLRNLNLGPVHIHPDPSEAEVLRLLGEAACVIYPSAEEGFGLPIVEAGEVGAPLVYDRLARIPTEALGLHTLGVEGANVERWAEAIQAAVEGGPVPDALSDLPTWAESARAYVDLYGITADAR